MKRYMLSTVGTPGKQELKMEESCGGAWVQWGDVIKLLGDDWGVCDCCGNLELVSNLSKIILASDLSIPNYGITGSLPRIDGGELFNMTLLLCPNCKTAWIKATEGWFRKGKHL